MSRTYRKPIPRRQCYKQPRYAQILRASKDEFGIRYGAIPTRVRVGKWVSSSKTDWKTKNSFHQVCRPTTVAGEANATFE